MACTIAVGRAVKCKDIAAGIKKLYFINYVAGLESSATFDATDDDITAFASALTLYEWILPRETALFDEQGETSEENGTNFYETSGTIILHVQSMTDRKNLMLLQAGRPHIITLDNAGNYKFYGLENGCNVKVSSRSGTAMGDAQGYSLEINAREKELAHFVDSTIIGDTTNTTVTTG